MEVRDQKKLVFVSTAVPAECVKNAQVAIVSKDSWHLIAPWPHRAHGLGRSIPMPEVRCPVVDVRPVQDEAKMRTLFNVCVVPYGGVVKLDELLAGLEALGAVVQRVAKKVQ